MTIGEGYKTVQDHMYEQIKSRFHSQFGAFPVVMEIETWLLGDSDVQHYLGQQPIPEPESKKHPTASLENIYDSNNKRYRKIIDGIDLFNRASAKRVFDDNCPHFKKLADWIKTPPIIPNPIAENLAAMREEWEREVDEKYYYWLDLEREAKTDSDLDEAIKAETDYKAFLQTYPQIFHQGE